MGKTLQARLDPVRRRQQQLHALTCAAWGLLASALVVLVCGAARWLGVWEFTVAGAAVMALAGPVLGYFAGLVWRRDFHAAAVAINSHYRLKDRATTALEFLAKPTGSTVHRLALDDAL